MTKQRHEELLATSTPNSEGMMLVQTRSCPFLIGFHLERFGTTRGNRDDFLFSKWDFKSAGSLGLSGSYMLRQMVLPPVVNSCSAPVSQTVQRTRSIFTRRSTGGGMVRCAFCSRQKHLLKCFDQPLMAEELCWWWESGITP